MSTFFLVDLKSIFKKECKGFYFLYRLPLLFSGLLLCNCSTIYHLSLCSVFKMCLFILKYEHVDDALEIL